MIQIKHAKLGIVWEQHEQSVPALVYLYRAGLTAGALGGIAMIAVALLHSLLNGSAAWLPVNLIGATLIAGLFLHMAISIALGFVFVLLLPALPGSPLVWSLTVGALLWSLAGLIVLPLFNPITAIAVDAPLFLIAYLTYGLVLGGWIARTPKIRAE